MSSNEASTITRRPGQHEPQGTARAAIAPRQGLSLNRDSGSAFYGSGVHTGSVVCQHRRRRRYFAVAGLLFLLGPAAVLQVGLLGMLSPRVVHRFAMVAASGADVANPPQVSSTLSDEQLRLGWRNSFIALQRTTLPW